jgi:multidrug efflux pump
MEGLNMFYRFFIDRPVLSVVLPILILIAAIVAGMRLNISEYPAIAPPTVLIATQYPGATPRTLSDQVASPIERELNSLEELMYMTSNSTTDGRYLLRLTFELETNLDSIIPEIQNRISAVLPKLPKEVKDSGVIISEDSPDLTLVIHFTYDEAGNVIHPRDYLLRNVRNNLERIPGVGSVALFGSGDPSMRIWLNPRRVESLKLNASDIIKALKEQSVAGSAGVIGASPSDSDTITRFPVNISAQLTKPEAFDNVVIKRGSDGTASYLKDVAETEYAPAEYAVNAFLDSEPAIAIMIFQKPNSDSLQIAEDVKSVLSSIKHSLPSGMQYSIVYDTTDFINESLGIVGSTLIEALLLVAAITLFFLRSWNAAIIPLITLPVSVAGTLIVLYLSGQGINTLSLFGIILAVGIIVDDAIIIAENTIRHINTGISAKEATILTLKETSGSIFIVTLIISIMLLPLGYIGGISGEFYKPIVITVVASVILSAAFSLSFGASLFSIMMKSSPLDQVSSQKKIGLLTSELQKITLLIDKLTTSARIFFLNNIKNSLQNTKVYIFSYGFIVLTIPFFLYVIPSDFIPSQDKKYLIAAVQLPPGATLERTTQVVRDISEEALKERGIVHAVQFPGISINGFTNSSSAAVIFFTLDSFEKRSSYSRSAKAITRKLHRKFQKNQYASVTVFSPPPVAGLGATGGFKFFIEDRGNLGYTELNKTIVHISEKLKNQDEILFTYSGFNINSPYFQAEINRDRAEYYKVSINDIMETLQIYIGSVYVNDFNNNGLNYKVIAQADQKFRKNHSNILSLKVRSRQGEMVPIRNLITMSETHGPELSVRYNNYVSADMNGFPAPGYSKSQAEAAVERVLKDELASGFHFEWTGLSYQENEFGHLFLYFLPLCIAIAYLLLSAYFESFSVSLVVISVMPLAIFSILVGSVLTAQYINVFTQISFFVLAGLSCRNAQMITEVALRAEECGMNSKDAVFHAVSLRLRPIVMTSITFIAGAIPLLITTGAGSEIRFSLGVSVISGMLGASIFSLIYIPVIYVTIRDKFAVFQTKAGHP